MVIACDKAEDFDLIVTNFKIDYDNFSLIYQKLLENDYIALSDMAAVDHINISSRFMELHTELIEAQDDLKQLMKRLGNRNTAYSTKSEFLQEIFSALQSIVVCRQLNEIFNQ